MQGYAGATACIENGRDYSYADLLARIDQVAIRLPPERTIIPIEEPSIFEGLAQLLAIADSPHLAIPLPHLPEGQQRVMRAAAGLDGASMPKLYDELTRSGLILFSSGTSGKPKGMLHNLPALLRRYEGVRPRRDRVLQLLLIDHIGGLDAALRCLLAGSTLVIPKARTAEAAAASIAAHRVSVLPASPTFLNLMLINGVHQSYDCSSVKIIAYGAEAMSAPLLSRLGEAFPGAELQQKFGTSETGAIRIESAGRDSLFFCIKDRDTEWKILEDELWLRNPARILGYLDTSTGGLENDGWYRTGDLVEQDGEGRIRIVGRASALINIGGQKVHPTEIETVLLEMLEVEACRVFGESNPITGQQVACEIFSQAERNLQSWKQSIRQHCRGKLAPWKIPSSVTICPELQVSDRLKRR